MKYLLGYSIPHASTLPEIIYQLAKGRRMFWWPELAFGMLWIAILVVMKNAGVLHRFDACFAWQY